MGSDTEHDRRPTLRDRGLRHRGAPPRHGRRRPAPRRILALGTIAAFTAAACTGGDGADDAATEAPAEIEVDRGATDDGGDARAEAPAEEALDVAPGVGVSDGATGGIDLGSVGREVVIEMRVSMTSDDVAAAVDAISLAAAGAGGGVASSDIDYGPPAEDGGTPTGRATMVIKVPPDRLDAVLSSIDAAGTVTSLEQDATDVTEQLVDLDVRISNTRASVERVRALLDEASDVRGVVELEAELTSRQIELERLLAQQRTLRDRVALSTITIDIRSTPTVIERTEPGPDDGIGDAFARGWEAFVAVLFGIGFVAAVAAPFVAVGVVMAIAAWLAVRDLRRRRATPPTAHRAPAADGVGGIGEVDAAANDELGAAGTADPDRDEGSQVGPRRAR